LLILGASRGGKTAQAYQWDMLCEQSLKGIDMKAYQIHHDRVRQKKGLGQAISM
jgi:hypothetical protein